MAVYKGYEVDDRLYSVIRYIPQVEKYREALEHQQVFWDYLNVMAQLERLENDLGRASQQFSHLTGVLLNRLGLETISKVVNEYGFKAQVIINILVRNLFERTADIGFLATDENIRAFLQACAEKNLQASLLEARQSLIERFAEYVQKYSVYDDVILLDAKGYVQARLNPTQSVERSNDALIQAALSTQDAYVERFGYSDLFPNQKQSLIYAYRVTDIAQEKVLGVVCLCFKFDDEIKGVFQHLLCDASLETLLLLDAESQVIASGAENVVSVGTKIKVDTSKPFSIVSSKGKEFLCCVKQAEPYQGYRGLGWVGCVLLALDKVFAGEDKALATTLDLDKETLDSVMEGNLFDPATKSIPVLAGQIEAELNRSVWNGNAKQASERNGSDAVVSRVLLDEIKNTGGMNKAIFENAILAIQTTVISEILRLSQSSATLAIDIMDRNLYERANDCRWWVLDTRLRSILAKPEKQADDIKQIQSILQYINGLYTVYTNLIVFDQHARVIATSQAEADTLVGAVLDFPWARALLQHTDSAQYVVSDFKETPLYGNQPTYIYGAAIRNMDGQKVVGGIAIVFDAAPQFQKMLEDVLASEQDAGRLFNFALFTDAHDTIIASTHPDFSIGQSLQLGASFRPAHGEDATSHLFKFQGHHYAAACAKSKGYREYKGEYDPYQQEVFAYVMLDLGAVKEVSSTKNNQPVTSNKVLSSGGYKTQISSFYVGGDWFGVQSEKIECAIHVDKVIPVHGNIAPEVLGYVLYKKQSILLMRSSALLGVQEVTQHATEAVIVKVQNRLVALTVDALGETLDVNQDAIQPLVGDIAATRRLVKSVVSTQAQQNGAKMLQLLDPELMVQEMKNVVEMPA